MLLLNNILKNQKHTQAPSVNADQPGHPSLLIKDFAVHVISNIDITKTSPCNEHPLTPHFYIVKLGFTGVCIIFLFLL